VVQSERCALAATVCDWMAKDGMDNPGGKEHAMEFFLFFSSSQHTRVSLTESIVTPGIDHALVFFWSTNTRRAAEQQRGRETC
jgi:hypothetical protein